MKSQSYIGRVDYDGAVPEPPDHLAREALVCLIDHLIGHWEHPVAYVLKDKCSADVQAQLIRDCIGLLHEENINVKAMVFYGTFTNQSTAEKLGCKIKVEGMQTWFPHPVCPDKKVFTVFDACHMIKLMRNLLADYEVITQESEGNVHYIKWQYFRELNSLQEKVGLIFTNKLSSKHIAWTKNKMKVTLAAQTLRSSVAAAFDFLREDMNFSEFHRQ